MNYTGHCLDKFTGRPNTAPVANTFRSGTADEAKKDWDRFRFGQQTNSYGDTLGRYSLSNLKTDRTQGIRHTSYNDNPKTHPLIKFENQVLEYRVIYEERVRTEDGSHIEPHDCLLRFFVEDGTLEIIEKPVSNSGRTEFRLVKRATVLKEGGKDKYTARDLIPGNRIMAYGMSFQILHGTQLAQSYTTTRFGEPAAITDRPSTANSLLEMNSTFGGNQGNRLSTASLMSTRKERISSFLTQQDFSQQIDNICLDLVWDDSNALYGDVHFLKLKYYLLDDTADVFCIDARKFETKYSGSRAIVKRQKLQKETELSAPLQGLDSRMRLSSGSSQRYQAPKQQYIDCNAPGTFYHWSELLPGTSVTILGRVANVIGFGNTRSELFYSKMMGEELVSDLKEKYRPKALVGEMIPTYQHDIPEHSGIGSYEDSMRSVKAIAPEAPPSGSSNAKALRFKLQFKARLLSNIVSDQTRTFIVSYFCEDGTMMVFEASPRNSGRASYTFAGRSKYVRIFDANQGNEPIYYGAKDIYVGAILVINGHHLELEEAAAGTNKFLKEFSGQFD